MIKKKLMKPVVVIIIMMKHVKIVLKKFKTDEINKEAELFKINIHIYTQDENDHAEIDRRNSGNYDKEIYLLRHNHPFSLIKDIKAFIHSFRC